MLPSLGCDKATPVAPGGTTLTISANPTKISLTGSSTLTIVGRKPDGNPLNPGTEIRLSTDRGTVEPIVTVDSSGRATATLRADGRSGAAKVTASAGDANVETTIQIGETTETKPVLLISANPSTVPVEGTADITVIARNADGSPVGGGQTVILTTSLGRITPSRPVTRADGTATATLEAQDQAGTATITAIMGSSDAATTTVTIREGATDISVQANPRTIPRAGGDVTLTAFVTNSQGQPLQGAPVTFEATAGDLEITGVVFTDTSGVAENVLTLDQDDLPPGVTEIEVTVTTPSGDGTLIEDTTTINVQ